MCSTQEVNVMVLIGSLRLIVGLVSLGVVIALCLWLLNKLFPGITNVPDDSQNNIVHGTLQAQQTPVAEERRKHKISCVTQEHDPPNSDEYQDERIV